MFLRLSCLLCIRDITSSLAQIRTKVRSCIYRAQTSVRLSSVLRFLSGTISPPRYLFLVCTFAILQAAQDHLPDTIPTHTKFRCPNAFITFFIQVHFPYAVTDRPSLPVFIDLLRRDSCNAVYLTGCKIRAYDLSSLNISQGVPVFSTLLHISFPLSAIPSTYQSTLSGSFGSPGRTFQVSEDTVHFLHIPLCNSHIPTHRSYTALHDKS